MPLINDANYPLLDWLHVQWLNRGDSNQIMLSHVFALLMAADFTEADRAKLVVLGVTPDRIQRLKSLAGQGLSEAQWNYSNSQQQDIRVNFDRIIGMIEKLRSDAEKIVTRR